MIIGIPFVAVLVNTLLFGHLLQDNASSQFGICIIIAFCYTAFYWLTFRMMFRYIAAKYPTIRENKKRRLLTAVTVFGGYVLLQYVLDVFLHHLLLKYAQVNEPNSVLKIITSLLFIVLILAVYEGIYLSMQVRHIEYEKSQVMKENINSQLAGLKNQINPHFLFNSLNTLSSLVHEDAQRADAFVSKLSKVYRYILDKNDEHLVHLKDELYYLQSYAYLMKERFGDNIRYEENIDQKYMHKYILPLSLQITFENCIKHNIISKEKPLAIQVVISNDGEYLTITNNLQKINFPEVKTAVGLDNIIKRYSYFTDNAVAIHQDATTFSVSLPLLDKDALSKINL